MALGWVRPHPKPVHHAAKRYRHTARHLAECGSLAPLIGDYEQFGPHEAFACLRARHGCKMGFWSQVA